MEGSKIVRMIPYNLITGVILDKKTYKWLLKVKGQKDYMYFSLNRPQLMKEFNEAFKDKLNRKLCVWPIDSSVNKIEDYHATEKDVKKNNPKIPKF